MSLTTFCFCHSVFILGRYSELGMHRSCPHEKIVFFKVSIKIFSSNSISFYDQSTLLHIACLKGQFNIVKLQIRNNFDCTLLDIACLKGQFDAEKTFYLNFLFF